MCEAEIMSINHQTTGYLNRTPAMVKVCVSVASGSSLGRECLLCVLVNVLMLLGKYLLNTRIIFARRIAWWTNALKAST